MADLCTRQPHITCLFNFWALKYLFEQRADGRSSSLHLSVTSVIRLTFVLFLKTLNLIVVSHGAHSSPLSSSVTARWPTCACLRANTAWHLEADEKVDSATPLCSALTESCRVTAVVAAAAALGATASSLPTPHFSIRPGICFHVGSASRRRNCFFPPCPLHFTSRHGNISKLWEIVPFSFTFECEGRERV